MGEGEGEAQSRATNPATEAAHTAQTACLCTFDVDRTLTGKQEHTEECKPDANVVTECSDDAYGHGNLTLSEVGQAIGNTFCADCFVGIVTAGWASGPSSCERKVLEEKLNATGKLLSADWSGPSATSDDRKSCQDWSVSSTLMAGCADGTKQYAVQGIAKWLKTQGIDIPAENIWHFDDRADNVQPFESTGMNARQISCASRDPGYGTIGFCGASASEMVRELGVHTCVLSRGH